MQRCSACFYRTATNRADLAHRLDEPITVFRRSGRHLAQNRSSGINGVDRIRLSPRTPILAVGPRYLDHCYPVSMQIALQASAVGAGPFQAGLDHLAVRANP